MDRLGADDLLLHFLSPAGPGLGLSADVEITVDMLADLASLRTGSGDATGELAVD